MRLFLWFSNTVLGALGYSIIPLKTDAMDGSSLHNLLWIFAPKMGKIGNRREQQTTAKNGWHSFETEIP